LIPFSTRTGLEFNNFSAYNESLLPLTLESINKVSEVNQKKLPLLDEEGYIKYLDKYEMSKLLSNNDIKNSIKKKYLGKPCIYLWVNNINNKSYVGKSINLFNRLNKNYLSNSYINRNKGKMAICGAIYKYGINNFTLYVLEVVNLSLNKEIAHNTNFTNKNYLMERENYWYEIIMPSYNLQSIILPFTGANHYRFGKFLSQNIKSKISKTLTGRILSEKVKINHSIGAIKKKVFCFDWNTGEYLMEFAGIRIMERAVGKNNSYIRHKLDKNKPFLCTINNVEYKMNLKSKRL
jgi:group I intron endonuclease